MNTYQAHEALRKAIEKAPIIPPCQTTDPEVFFPSFHDENSMDFRPAKKLCQVCPVVAQCLQYALIADEPHGIWGGLSPKERYRLKKNLKAA